MRTRLWLAALAICPLAGASGCAAGILWGCKRPEVTAYSLNPGDVDRHGKPIETGIPFYLPKPLLIIAKNFRNVEEATVGLTDSAPIPAGYDDQSKYADLNARTNFNGLQGETTTSTPVAPSSAATNTGTAHVSGPRVHSLGAPVVPGQVPSDGLAPATFYTYHIVFVPDLTQKFGLKIRGGPGEIRAAMNLVNGWQFTGIGPFYMKDSSTAQNILANGIATRLGGQAAADILNASANLAKLAGQNQGGAIDADDRNLQAVSKTISELRPGMAPMCLPNFAQIHVYEARLTPDGQMVWSEIADLCFDRQFIGMERTDKVYAAPTGAPAVKTAGGAAQGAAVSESVARTAVAGVLGIPVDSAALAAPAGQRQGGAVGAVGGVPPGGVNQIQVDCGGNSCPPASKEFNLFKFGAGCKKEPPPRAVIQNRRVTTSADILETAPPGPPTVGGAAQAGSVEGKPGAQPAIVNQQFFNTPPAGAQPPPAKNP